MENGNPNPPYPDAGRWGGPHIEVPPYTENDPPENMADYRRYLFGVEDKHQQLLPGFHPGVPLSQLREIVELTLPTFERQRWCDLGEVSDKDFLKQ